jgi:SNF2 family DNA or RNA helicase
MIANILDGKPADGGTNNTTLIVCPAGLCIQWFKEIERHTEKDALGAVMIYRGASRHCYSDPIAALTKFNVIITTYSEVNKSYPKYDQPRNLITEENQRKWWEERFENELGFLHRINFRRIVLDEAQVIKNHDSKVSLACRSLHGKYRWALTGTPIQNKVEEFFPYFSFLKVDHTGNYGTFASNYCKRGSNTGLERLRAILARIMIRRTHDDEMFGRPLVDLPNVRTKTVTVEFNPVEKAIYKIVRNRFIARVRMYAKAGPLNQSYRGLLVLYLRLRQLVGHILLIQKTIIELLEAEDLEKLWKLTESEVRASSGNREVLTQLKSMLSNKKPPPSSQGREKPQMVDLTTEIAKQGQSSQQEQSTPTSLGGNFGLSFKFRGILRNLHESGKWEEINSRSVCHKCGHPPQDPRITACMHIYCTECLLSMSYEASTQGREKTTCLECDTEFSGSESCKGFEQVAFSMAGEPSSHVGLGSREALQSADEDVDWVNMTSSTLPSAKTLGIKAQCLHWHEEDPSAKIVIFTQFKGMIRILQRMCREEQWGCLQYHGAMTADARENVVQDFQDDPDKKILIASLKAGGIGLNLTMASKVIIMDLWWNASVEDQAFCRCFRIGQTKEVDITRFVVKDTIDDDILAMQERKTKEIDAALETRNQARNLSVKDLVRLFGPMQVDEDGNLMGDPEDEPFIFVQDTSGDEDRSDGEMVVNKVPSRPVDWKSSNNFFRG